MAGPAIVKVRREDDRVIVGPDLWAGIRSVLSFGLIMQPVGLAGKYGLLVYWCLWAMRADGILSHAAQRAVTGLWFNGSWSSRPSCRTSCLGRAQICVLRARKHKFSHSGTGKCGVSVASRERNAVHFDMLLHKACSQSTLRFRKLFLPSSPSWMLGSNSKQHVELEGG